ncbi:MAG: sugar ABC transporter permease [Gemmatimonadetes bacterium]|nr:sugar ABC transporter permease [Gemmatimonadota bacterium]
MSEALRRTRILRAALVVAVAGSLTAFMLANGTIDRTAGELAEEEGAMAAALSELLQEDGAESAIRSLLGSRFSIVAAPASDVPGPTVQVPLYRPGGMEPVATLLLDPPIVPNRGPTAGVFLILLAGAMLWRGSSTGRQRSPRIRRWATSGLLLLPALSAGGAGWWAGQRHEVLSIHYLSQSVRTYGLARAEGRQEAATASRVPWLPRESLRSGAEQWTMPPVLARSLSEPLPDRGKVVAEGTPYHLADVGDAILAITSYRATRSVLIPMAGTALGSMLLVALVLSLTGLAGRPGLLRQDLVGWAFLAPSAAHLLFFTFGPLVFSLWLSLHDWSLVDPTHPFVGLDQYARLATDAGWWGAVWNTLVFTLHVPLAMAVALALALLTRSSHRAMRWARLALFLPSVTSIVAIAIVWKWLLNDNYGLVNGLLGRLGLAPVAWLTSPDTALPTLMLVGIWLVVGYQMVVFQAGLASIPRDWYDAARVDGAGRWRTLWHITLPGLRRTLFFVLVTSVIGSFQVFGLVYVMTEGGPLGATDVAVFHIYREAWEYLQFGSAAAMSWMFFVVVFAATWLHFRLLDRSREGAHA